MGGGSQGGGATPTTPPGYTGGSAMDYTAPAYSASPVQGGGFNWGGLGQGIGQGFSNAGAGISAAANQPQPNFGSSSYQQQALNIPAGSPIPSQIPATGQSNQDEVFDMLKRLFADIQAKGGGGYG